MSQNVENFNQALSAFRSVGARVPADAWDNQSCCSDWTARQAAGHAVAVIQNVAASAAGTDAPEARPEAEVAGDDPAATIATTADQAQAALSGADLSQVIPTPFGEMPMDTFVGIIWIDTLTHAWDVADAAGIDHGIDADLATAARAAAEPLADTIRSLGGFGEAQPEPADDPVAAFIAFTGRVSVQS